MNEKLVLENTRLIHKVIKDMGLQCRTKDEYQNYYDWGLIGLINGVRTYDDTKTKPSTYLYRCIYNAIAREFYINSMQKRNNKHGKDISIYTKIDEGKNGKILTIYDTAKDEKVNIEEEIIKKDRIERLYKAIDKLDPEEQEYIKSYYGICGYTEQSSTELAKKYNITRRAINSRIVRIRLKLKRHIEKL